MAEYLWVLLVVAANPCPKAFCEDRLGAISTGAAVVYKDQSAGLMDLQTYVPTSLKETAWAYAEDKNMWVKDGISADEISVALDPNLVTSLLRAHPSLVLVHTHPPYPQIQSPTRECMYKVVRLLPSELDFFSAWYLSEVASKADPPKSVRFMVVSAGGIAEYGVSAGDLQNLGPPSYDNEKLSEFYSNHVWKPLLARSIDSLCNSPPEVLAQELNQPGDANIARDGFFFKFRPRKMDAPAVSGQLGETNGGEIHSINAGEAN